MDGSSVKQSFKSCQLGLERHKKAHMLHTACYSLRPHGAEQAHAAPPPLRWTLPSLVMRYPKEACMQACAQAVIFCTHALPQESMRAFYTGYSAPKANVNTHTHTATLTIGIGVPCQQCMPLYWYELPFALHIRPRLPPGCNQLASSSMGRIDCRHMLPALTHCIQPVVWMMQRHSFSRCRWLRQGQASLVKHWWRKGIHCPGTDEHRWLRQGQASLVKHGWRKGIHCKNANESGKAKRH